MTVPISNMHSTFANTTIRYDAIGMDVNVFAYAANSTLINLKANGNSRFSVDVTGNTTVNGTIYIAGSIIANGDIISLSDTGDITAKTLTANVISGNTITSNTITSNTITSNIANINLLSVNSAVFTGTITRPGAIFTNAVERVNVTATAATGNTNYYISNQSILYFTSNATANFSCNISWAPTTNLNSVLDNGDSITIAWLVSQGTVAYINRNVFVDGVQVIPKWQGGSSPTVGNASSIDSYIYNIIKTDAGAFTIFASQTQFK